MKKDRAAFHKNVTPRASALEYLSSDCYDLNRAGDTRPIFCSFSCDPWQQVDVEYGITREALIILFTYSRSVILLTKGGKRSLRDFDLLAANAHRVMYGATLVFKDDAEALKHEPNAAPTSERLDALREAHNKGIRTWVSLEPVYTQGDTFALIDATRSFVDCYKVGKLNYMPEANEIDWRKFAVEVEEKLKSTGKEYYIKSDLRTGR
jgi:DNA repair photolyase